MASTISISKELKEDLKNLGRAGESYEDVIRRMYELTKKRMLLDFLYDKTDCMTLNDFEKEIKNG